MQINIDFPKERHAEAITKICSEGWGQTVEGKLTEEFQAKNIDLWYNLARVKRDISNNIYSHIALHDEKVVGVVGGCMIDQNVGEVFLLYVDEQYRYQGIGKMLLNSLTKQQMKKGATEQWVSVQEDNYRGIPFYEARGFKFRQKRVTTTEMDEEQVSLRYSRRISK